MWLYGVLQIIVREQHAYAIEPMQLLSCANDELLYGLANIQLKCLVKQLVDMYTCVTAMASGARSLVLH